jgi:hypothetical protein
MLQFNIRLRENHTPLQRGGKKKVAEKRRTSRKDAGQKRLRKPGKVER